MINYTIIIWKKGARRTPTMRQGASAHSHNATSGATKVLSFVGDDIFLKPHVGCSEAKAYVGIERPTFRYVGDVPQLH